MKKKFDGTRKYYNGKQPQEEKQEFLNSLFNNTPTSKISSRVQTYDLHK